MLSTASSLESFRYGGEIRAQDQRYPESSLCLSVIKKTEASWMQMRYGMFRLIPTRWDFLACQPMEVTDHPHFCWSRPRPSNPHPRPKTSDSLHCILRRSTKYGVVVMNLRLPTSILQFRSILLAILHYSTLLVLRSVFVGMGLQAKGP